MFNSQEIQNLAKEIGIDYETEKEKYLWFLIQVIIINFCCYTSKIVNLELPPGWMREEDPSGVVYYHNPNENITSTKHPQISKFRLLFNEILE